MRDNRMCYVARCKCGCGVIRAASLDEPEFRSDTAKFVGELIMNGYSVEHIPVAQSVLGACKGVKL